MAAGCARGAQVKPLGGPFLIIAVVSGADSTARGACPQCVACSDKCNNDLGLWTCAVRSSQPHCTGGLSAGLGFETSSQRRPALFCSAESARSASFAFASTDNVDLQDKVWNGSGSQFQYGRWYN